MSYTKPPIETSFTTVLKFDVEKLMEQMRGANNSSKHYFFVYKDESECNGNGILDKIKTNGKART